MGEEFKSIGNSLDLPVRQRISEVHKKAPKFQRIIKCSPNFQRKINLTSKFLRNLKQVIIGSGWFLLG